MSERDPMMKSELDGVRRRNQEKDLTYEGNMNEQKREEVTKAHYFIAISQTPPLRHKCQNCGLERTETGRGPQMERWAYHWQTQANREKFYKSKCFGRRNDDRRM